MMPARQDDSPPLPRLLTRFSWPDALAIAAWFGAFLALQAWAHWNMWLALAAPLAILFLVRAAADMWPRKVPAELAADVRRLEAGGWRPLRRHPWLCTEKRPHVHMAAEGGKPVMVTYLGKRPHA